MSMVSATRRCPLCPAGHLPPRGDRPAASVSPIDASARAADLPPGESPAGRGGQREALPHPGSRTSMTRALQPHPPPADQQHSRAADRRRRHLLPAGSGARRRGRRLSRLDRRRCRHDRGAAPSTGASTSRRCARLGLYLCVAAASRSRLVGHLLRGRSSTSILERLPNTLLLMGSADGAVLRPRLAARHRRRRAAGQRPRPAALHRLAGALCRARLLAGPGAERRLCRAAALAADRRHRDDRVGQDGLARALDIARHLVLPVARARLHLPGALPAHDARGHGRGLAAWISCSPPRARGIPRRRIVLRHVARNALLPLVTMLGLQSAAMLGGSVVIESVFAVPGLGRLAQEAVGGARHAAADGHHPGQRRAGDRRSTSSSTSPMPLLDPRVGASGGGGMSAAARCLRTPGRRCRARSSSQLLAALALAAPLLFPRDPLSIAGPPLLPPFAGPGAAARHRPARPRRAGRPDPRRAHLAGRRAGGGGRGHRRRHDRRHCWPALPAGWSTRR